MRRIHRLLIANRGEIARRIQCSARALGIETVAVYSDADRNALHVREADQALCLGGATASQSYLNREALLAALRDTGADALHPGYGFLSEDADFAEAVEAAGIIWVGPPPKAMRAMASKAAAKQTLEPRGVPMIPGYHGDDQGDARLLAEAEGIGFPLLVKASAGGGGKGMRVVEQLDQVADALASARREASNAFGDDRLLLERYLVNPRHVEVQIMADSQGSVWSLFERDCSLQRRHQKVVEEAPAPALAEDTRQAMWQAAEVAASSIGYVGAGTVEYIVDASGDFFFLEMNTRLQVEHPVTECITGLDLVALQLRIAEGEPLPAVRPTQPAGHAFEVRLYAEDPDQAFRPTSGTLSHVVWPQGPGVRIDTGIESGSEVSPFYDPMLAKLIVHGASRNEALARLNRALAETRLVGLTTNLNFLRRLCAAQDVAEFNIHTHWIEAHRPLWQSQPEQPACWSALAASAIQDHLNAGHADPWQRLSGWRRFQQKRWIYNRSETEQCVVTGHQGVWQAHCGSETLTLSDVHVEHRGQGHYRLHSRTAQHRRQLDVWPDGTGIEVDDGHSRWHQIWWQAEAAHEDGSGGDGQVRALMPGTVTAIHQTAGKRVKRGDKILSMEAMKMETTLTAPLDGTLVQCSLSVGDRVEDGQLVFVVEPDEEAAA
jgi:3-methylcrotonyl-CoA carboxylase alpha subunit